MQRHAIVAVGSWLIAAWTATASGQAVVPPRAGLEEAVARLEGFIREEMEVHRLPAVSIALVEGKQIVWARGFGLARPAEGIGATAETVHRVGSVSKLFTDLAVMQLVERGELDLDAPVTRYLPDFAPHGSFEGAITLRQLMAHRSGLVRESPVGHYFDATSPTLETTVRSLNSTDLIHAPGAKTKYSNAAIATVGRVVEKVKGEPFGSYVKRAVLEPLGMKASDFEETGDLAKRLAVGQMWTYDGRTFDAPTFPLGTAPAGNLYSTALDLGQFLIALLDEGRGPGGPVVKAETLKAMWTPQFADKGATRGFGLGFNIGALDDHRRVGHNGAVYGFATEVAALPDDGIGVAVVITKDCANTIAGRIGNAALRMLLALKAGKPLPTIETTAPLAPGLARRLDGRYGEGDTAVELAARGDSLFLTRATGGFRLGLRAEGDMLVADDISGFGTRVVPGEGSIKVDGKELKRVADRMPEPIPSRWAGLIGEYGWDHNTLYILERNGRLFALIEWFFLDPLEEVSPDVFTFPADRGLYHGESLKFTRDASGRSTKVEAASVDFPRRKIDGDDGSTFQVALARPVGEVRREALAASPPAEKGGFRKPDLVDLTTLEPTIKLDIRYATANNFAGTPFYSSARAFMQRPAAEALARAHRGLKEKGYGLLIHDAYRPWYVSKMFWDATPESAHGFVADPSKGSKHNRGCAVDLTLHDLATGRPIEMVGGYDEFSARSSPDYPGGTSRQRWHRELLRRAMEAEGFTVNAVEWWHFDHRDWPKYHLLNAAFEDLAAPR
ncbi:MAG TPA: serine hydrolase [Isosphaeraceae bacterium]|jgi:CubicO group peptidase (beta-lactamase class C family)/D-alanyl-D-alanine dipeptidase